MAPAPPVRRILGEAQIVREVERAHPRSGQLLELILVGRQRLRSGVEAALETAPNEGFDLGAVVVGGDEHLVAGLEADRADSLEEGVSPEPEAGGWRNQASGGSGGNGSSQPFMTGRPPPVLGGPRARRSARAPRMRSRPVIGQTPPA